MAKGTKQAAMYTGRPSKPGKTTVQRGTGLAKTDGKGFQDTADVRKTKATKPRLDQG